MSKHIGNVACSAEGAALCYQTICREGAVLLGAHAYPEISMHTHPLAEYMEFIYRDDWDGVAGLMISSARKLEAARKGYSRSAILGTKYLMTGPVYAEAFSKNKLDSRIPDQAVREKIDTIIFDELVYGEIRDESREFFLSQIKILKESGCDSVVLGCTEIPLIVLPDESPLPILDSTRILARAALHFALNEQS